MAFVAAETATVYRAGGRRFLTRAAAYRRLASMRVRGSEKYTCECEAEVGFDCGLHTEENEALVEKLIARLARWYARADRDALQSTDTNGERHVVQE